MNMNSFEMEISCYIVNIFIVSFDQFNASLLNKKTQKSLNPSPQLSFHFLILLVSHMASNRPKSM